MCNADKDTPTTSLEDLETMKEIFNKAGLTEQEVKQLIQKTLEKQENI
jgi:hypothetical protein